MVHASRGAAVTLAAREDSAMLVSILAHVPLALFPLLQIPQPTRDCQFEILRPEVIEARALSRESGMAIRRSFTKWGTANMASATRRPLRFSSA